MRRPAGCFDDLTGLGVVALAAWTVAPDGALTGALLLAAGALQIARLARWAGDRTLRDRLVLILHVAYAFVPLASRWPGSPRWGWSRRGRHPCLDRRRARRDDAGGDVTG